ncbi:TIGR02391 family protein [Candidatus Poribacteria bacterium]|nr:TIGR02391 family protein [Candidatus Poribacteria bacterium]
MFKKIFPPIEKAIEMEPEELAPFVLRHLKKIGKINRGNYTLRGQEELRQYSGEHLEKFQRKLMEAFVWLERELFVAPLPDELGEWRFITEKGERILEEEDFSAYTRDSLLSSETLNPILVRKVKPLFIRGDYDTAIFQAFKIVEAKVRERGGYSNNDYGVDLMRKAFHPENGKLRNEKAVKAEREAMSHLFAGVIGLFKNPSSHRIIENIAPEDAADLIRFASFLLRTIEN